MDNTPREFKYKFGHRPWLGFITSATLFIIFMVVLFEFGLERAIFHAFHNMLGNRDAAEIIAFIITITLAISSWKIGFSFAQYDGFAALHGSHVRLILKDTEHVIKYSQVKNISVVGLSTCIFLNNGTRVEIPLSLKLTIRDSITAIRFANALDKEWRSSTRSRARKRK